MIVYACFSNGLVRSLGGLAGVVQTHIELVALAGSEAVVVVELVVELDFYVVVDVVVETKGICHA